jgi:hypothetical protein
VNKDDAAIIASRCFPVTERTTLVAPQLADFAYFTTVHKKLELLSIVANIQFQRCGVAGYLDGVGRRGEVEAHQYDWQHLAAPRARFTEKPRDLIGKPVAQAAKFLGGHCRRRNTPSRFVRSHRSILNVRASSLVGAPVTQRKQSPSGRSGKKDVRVVPPSLMLSGMIALAITPLCHGFTPRT